MNEFERVAPVGDLAKGEMTLVTANGEDVVMARVGDDDFAVEAICSHAFGMLNEGTLHGHDIQCPIHAGRFDLRTGRPTQAPADQPIVAYEVRVEDDDVLVGPPRR